MRSHLEASSICIDHSKRSTRLEGDKRQVYVKMAISSLPWSSRWQACSDDEAVEIWVIVLQLQSHMFYCTDGFG